MKIQNIVVVEDELIIQMFITRVLTNEGYRVVAEVRNGDDAINACKEKSPDLVLMDVGINGSIDGIETAKYIKECCDLPIIFMTGNSDEATLERAKKVEPVGFVFKPIDEQRLIKQLEELCST